MLEHFEHAYAWYALIAGISVGLICSLMSVIVVLKRMAFIGQGISHAGFGGIGTAALLGFTGEVYLWQQDFIVLVFCIATALVIGMLTRSKRVETDSAIGILLTASMAWGVISQSLRVTLQSYPWYQQWVGGTGYTPHWESILFGSILNVGKSGMINSMVLLGIVLIVGILVFKELVAFSFDETMAYVNGVRTKLMHYLLLVMLSVVVVVGIRLVGLILISALLIIPGATALMLSSRLYSVLIWASVIGVLSSAGGLLVSLGVGELPPGACIVMILCGVFGLVYFLMKLGKKTEAYSS